VGEPYSKIEPYDPMGDAQAVIAEEIIKRYPKTLQKLANSE
jgi:hypothetical protein